MDGVLTSPSGPSDAASSAPPPRSTRGRALRLLAFAVLSATLGVVGYVTLAPSSDGTTSSNVAVRSTTTTTKAVTPADIYQAILPSLAFITSRRTGVPGVTIGSGVVINANGQIMTANHVVQNASEIQVAFSDGTTSRAQIVSSQPANDIAVLQPDHGPGVIVPAVLGGGTRVGDPAFAIGNPLGLAASFTSGVISGLDRSFVSDELSVELQGLIQFDAAVNPGSSGGPLLNRNGQVIGIVTGLANATGQDLFAGIGFAVPIATAGGAARVPAR